MYRMPFEGHSCSHHQSDLKFSGILLVRCHKLPPPPQMCHGQNSFHTAHGHGSLSGGQAGSRCLGLPTNFGSVFAASFFLWGGAMTKMTKQLAGSIGRESEMESPREKPWPMVSLNGLSRFIPQTLGHSLLSTSKQKHPTKNRRCKRNLSFGHDPWLLAGEYLEATGRGHFRPHVNPGLTSVANE